jgi:hypothetical protein
MLSISIPVSNSAISAISAILTIPVASRCRPAPNSSKGFLLDTKSDSTMRERRNRRLVRDRCPHHSGHGCRCIGPMPTNVMCMGAGCGAPSFPACYPSVWSGGRGRYLSDRVVPKSTISTPNIGGALVVSMPNMMLERKCYGLPRTGRCSQRSERMYI